MENKSNVVVPYIVHESAQARAERNTKRLIVALIIAVVMVFASNAAWLWAWMQYDYVSDSTTTETITVDGKDGAANYANNGGSIINGAYSSQDEDQTGAYTVTEWYAGDP